MNLSPPLNTLQRPERGGGEACEVRDARLATAGCGQLREEKEAVSFERGKRRHHSSL